MIVSSRDNPFIKFVRSLRFRDYRETERAFIVEGRRAVEDAVEAGGALRWLVVREDEAPLSGDGAAGRVRTVDAKLFEFIAETAHPQGMLGVFEMPQISITPRRHPLFVILDAIADPGNLGSIIRTSAAAGADGLFLGDGCVDWLNGKVVRSAMGAHFRMPIAPFDEQSMAMIRVRCPLRVVSDGRANMTHDRVDWSKGAALIVGSEAHGVSEDFAAFATSSCAIPMSSGVESLNAGVAAGVILFEAQRQRRLKSVVELH